VDLLIYSSLFKAPITATDESVIQFGATWDKTTCTTYIKAAPSLYPMGKASVFSDKVRFKSYQFNFYDPHSNPGNQQSTSSSTTWFKSKNYDSYSDRKKIAYKYRDSYLFVDEQLHHFVLQGGERGAITVKIDP